MIGNLDQVLRSLLVEALPVELGGPTPPVQLSLLEASFVLEPSSFNAEADEPRVDEQIDSLAFDPANPHGPYTLTQPPSPGPRRVFLTSALGDRTALTAGEVSFDAADQRVLRLSPRAGRPLNEFDGLQVVYAVTAVYVEVKALRRFTLILTSADTAVLEQAEALALSVLLLNRARLIAAARATFTGGEGDYQSRIGVETLCLLEGSAPNTTTRRLELSARIWVKASRALRNDEGRPIARILSAGQVTRPGSPVDVEIGVNA